MIWALGIAATQSSGLCECLGTPAKSVGVGNAARNGLWSALLADKGFEGPPEPIAGVQGFFNAMGQPPDWCAFTDGLGETWEIIANVAQAVSLRLRDASGARLRARLAARASAAAVERVVVRGNPLLATAPTGRTFRPAASRR